MPENQRIIITFPHQWSTILLTKFVHQSDNFSNILQIRPPFSNHTCYKQHIVQSSVAEEPLCSFIKLSQILSNISLNANVNLSVVFRHSLLSVSESATEERGKLPARMENINSLLFTEASVGTTSHLQNVTFLQNAFMVTFFTYLGIEGLKYFIGQSYLSYNIIHTSCPKGKCRKKYVFLFGKAKKVQKC